MKFDPGKTTFKNSWEIKLNWSVNYSLKTKTPKDRFKIDFIYLGDKQDPMQFTDFLLLVAIKKLFSG